MAKPKGGNGASRKNARADGMDRAEERSKRSKAMREMADGDDWEDIPEPTDTIGLNEDGDSIEGIYLGYEVASTRFGDKRVHHFEHDDGEVIAVWGAAGLDRLLSRATLGRYTRCVRVGTGTEKNDRAGVYEVKQRGEVVKRIDPRTARPSVARKRGIQQDFGDDDIPF